MVEKMCSNTNNGSGGTKKQKVQKVPQRGPGVAELEKILREEQERKDDKAVVEGLSSCMVSTLPHYHHPQPSSMRYPMMTTSMVTPPSMMTNSPSLSNSLPIHGHLVQKFDQICPPPLPVTNFYDDNNNISQVGNGGDSRASTISKLSVVSPQNGYIPTMRRSSCKPNFNGCGPISGSGYPFSSQLSDESSPVWPSPPMVQRNLYQYRHSMMNFCPSPELPSPPPSSGRLNHHTEPPSNQRSNTNYTSSRPEEKKPYCRNEVSTGCLYVLPDGSSSPPQSSSIFPCMNRSDQPSTSSNCTAFNSEPGKTNSRGAQQLGLSEPKSKRCVTDSGALDGNILTLGPPTFPSRSVQNSEKDFSKFDFYLQNGSIDEQYGRSGRGGSVNQKPFYSFLQPKERTGMKKGTLSLDNRKGEAGRDNIDLNLKL